MTIQRMLVQAQAGAGALMDTVREAKASSMQDDIVALRQQFAELQRAHYEDMRGGAERGAECVSALAAQQSSEHEDESPWVSQLRQDAAAAAENHDEGHPTVATSTATADAILDLRAHLDRLSSALPAVRRLQAGRTPAAS